MTKQNDDLVLTKEEVTALVDELQTVFISHNNQLCRIVVYRMMKFLEESNNVRSSEMHKA
jgi:hypothetical protein